MSDCPVCGGFLQYDESKYRCRDCGKVIAEGRPEILSCELAKEAGIVFIKWFFADGTESDWLLVGEAPYPEGY